MSSQPVDSRADTIRIIPIDKRKTLHGVISDTKRVVRLDIARGITEATQSYIASRVEEELKGRAPNTSQDINDLKDTVRHLTDIIQKNTGAKIIAKTNEQDRIDSEEDEPILGSFAPPLSPIQLDLFDNWKIYGTKPNGIEWFSTAWNNGTINNRTLSNLAIDPFDPLLSYEAEAPTTTQLTIDGTGSARTTEFNSNIQLYVKSIVGDWKNTEMTAWFKRGLGDVGTTFKVKLRSRSNHEKVYSGQSPDDCGFGSYDVIWRHDAQTASIEVEPLHPIHTEVASVPWLMGIPENTWVGFKQITRDNLIDGTVTVEGWSASDLNSRGDPENWQKDVEFTFTGTNVDVDPTGNEARVTACLSKGSQTANDLDGLGTNFINRGGLHCIFEGAAFTYLRFNRASVREITPIQ